MIWPRGPCDLEALTSLVCMVFSSRKILKLEQSSVRHYKSMLTYLFQYLKNNVKTFKERKSPSGCHHNVDNKFLHLDADPDYSGV